MAGVGREERNAAADLIERLQATAASSSFFQIVRLFNRAAQRTRRGGGAAVASAAARPRDDAVRFRAAVGMAHPASEIVRARARESDGAPELTVSFIGLTGPTGVLPDYYTELLVAEQQASNPGAGDFLDLFNHRTIALFYRAWAKYRLPVRYEEQRRPLSDPFSQAAASIIGLGFEADRPLLEAEGGDILAVAGALGRRVRSAEALRSAIAALYELPVDVAELQGRWVEIDPTERTRVGLGQTYGKLGETAVLGAQVWDIQSRFRIRLGPMDLTTFRAFLEPGGVRESLVDMIRLSVGPAIEFDTQLVLGKADVPRTKLGDPEAPARLGQTTWLLSRPAEKDRDDAVINARWRPLTGEAAQAA